MVGELLPAIFTLLVAAAGWYYLFYSKAAQKLAAVEGEERNRLRVKLRRICGLVILLLAITFYAMTVALRDERFTAAGVLLLGVMILLAGIVILGLMDLRLTHKLRVEREKRNS